jgi:hypothetical protein
MEKLVLLESPYLNEIDFRIATVILTLLGHESKNQYLDLLIDDLIFGIDKFTDGGKRTVVMEGTGFDEDKLISSLKRLNKKSIIGSQKMSRNIFRVF